MSLEFRYLPFRYLKREVLNSTFLLLLLTRHCQRKHCSVTFIILKNIIRLFYRNTFSNKAPFSIQFFSSKGSLNSIKLVTISKIIKSKWFSYCHSDCLRIAKLWTDHSTLKINSKVKFIFERINSYFYLWTSIEFFLILFLDMDAPPSFRAELYFLVAKLLENGPCQSAAQTLRKGKIKYLFNNHQLFVYNQNFSTFCYYFFL